MVPEMAFGSGTSESLEFITALLGTEAGANRIVRRAARVGAEMKYWRRNATRGVKKFKQK